MFLVWTVKIHKLIFNIIITHTEGTFSTLYYSDYFTNNLGAMGVCSVQCAVCSVHCAVCSVQCAVCSVWWQIYHILIQRAAWAVHITEGHDFLDLCVGNISYNGVLLPLVTVLSVFDSLMPALLWTSSTNLAACCKLCDPLAFFLLLNGG